MDTSQVIQIQDLLVRRRDEFRGQLWRPRRLSGVTVVNLIMEVVGGLTDDINSLSFGTLPSAGKLTKWRHEMTIANEKLVRNRMFDQASFFRQIGVVFERAGRIFEELLRLERMGYFSLPSLETDNGKN